MPVFRALLISCVVLALGVTPAVAQEEDLVGNGIIDHPSEVGEGSCTPDVVGALELTTCVFPLSGPDGVLPDWPILATIGAPDFDDAFRRSECVVEDGALMCADLMGGWSEGNRDVWLALRELIAETEHIQGITHLTQFFA